MLRAARPDDADAVARVLVDSRARAMPWLAVVHDEDDVRQWTRTVLLPTRRVVVAEQDGDVAAVSALHDGWLEQLYVATDAQGRGLGRALLDDAKDASGGHLDLWAFARNERALRFYAGAGFVEVERTDGHANEEREPDVHLSWDRA